MPLEGRAGFAGAAACCAARPLNRAGPVDPEWNGDEHFGCKIAL
jgi:hypothetical protein